jgi:N-acetylglucosamine-6-phosphate deacetylase
MAETLIAAGRIVPTASALHDSPRARVGQSGIISPGYVLLRDGYIAAVGEGRAPRAPDVHISSGVLAPGFVDLQVNGYFGAELDAVRPAGWRMVASRLPETGTTAFMPTFITAPIAQLTEALRVASRLAPALEFAAPPIPPVPPGTAANAQEDKDPGAAGNTQGGEDLRAAVSAQAAEGRRAGGGAAGARVLGVHLEGPFISPLRAGAHNKDWMIEPSAEAVDQLLDAGSGILRIVTLAPELPGALEAASRLAAAGVVVSVGHSDATASQVSAAVGAGARMVTHLFNAQRPLHHREPGVVGQALSDPRLVSGLVADFGHVARAVCAIAFAAAPGRICLVTDAAACAGMPPGEYMLGGEPIELPAGDGVPPVRADGTLAGSALRMDVAVANMVSAGASLPEAIAAATRIPADLIGRPELGRIAPGALADLAWLDDDLRTRATWVAGELVYTR